MKIKFIFSLTVITALLLGSCGSSNNVVGGGLIQKRKFNKGFYLNTSAKSNNGSTAESTEKEEIVTLKDIAAEKTIRSQEATVESVATVSDVVEKEMTNSSTDALETMDGVEGKDEHTQGSTSTKKSTYTANSENEEIAASEETIITSPSKKQSAPAVDAMTILLVILAIILPPLAVGIYEGITKRFWIDLILWAIGWGVGFWLLGNLAWICSIVAIIYALLIVLEVI